MPKRRTRSSTAAEAEVETGVDIEKEDVTTPVARFNVGGTKYEVSRSLLSKYPDTMLARMASERWQEDPESIMFVERDGDRFKYVLDYMRDSRLSLSAQGQITKESILTELEYFGFSNIDPSNIAMEFTYLQAPNYIAQITGKYQQRIGELNHQRKDLCVIIACTTIAHDCCIRYMTTGNLALEFRITTRKVPDTYHYGHIIEDLIARSNANELDFQVSDAAKCAGITHYTISKELAQYGLRCVSHHSREERYNILESGQNKEIVGVVQVNVRLERL